MNPDELRRAALHDSEWALMAESIQCHAAGATRASYITAWVACAEALTARLDTMSRGHGGLARELQSYRDDPRDNDLIQMAEKYGFLQETEAETLRTIMKHRHQYAHPNNRRPKAFEVEFAIEYATKTVLARPAKTTAKLAKDLAQQIALDPHTIFPGDAAAKAWTNENKDTISEEARPAFFFELVSADLSSQTEADKKVLIQRRRVILDLLLEDWRPDFRESRWKLDQILNGDGWYDFACAALTIPHWPLIPDTQRPRIVQRVLSEAPPQLFAPPWNGLIAIARHAKYGSAEVRESLLRWGNAVDLSVFEDPWQPPILDFLWQRLNSALLNPWGTEEDITPAAKVLEWRGDKDFRLLASKDQVKLAESLMHAALIVGNAQAQRSARSLTRGEWVNSPFQERLREILKNPDEFRQSYSDPPF